MGGSTFNAHKRGPGFFEATIETALEELTKEDRLSLIRAVQDTSVEWNEISVRMRMKEKFSAFHDSMDDHWKDILIDSKLSRGTMGLMVLHHVQPRVK